MKHETIVCCNYLFNLINFKKGKNKRGLSLWTLRYQYSAQEDYLLGS